jgi:hypothetical protein
MYGHPARRHIPPLIRVPWLTCPFEQRKIIKEEEILDEPAEIDADIVSDPLTGLGYINE